MFLSCTYFWQCNFQILQTCCQFSFTHFLCTQRCRQNSGVKWDERMITYCEVKRNEKEASVIYMKTTFQHSAGHGEKKHRNPWSGWPMPWIRSSLGSLATSWDHYHLKLTFLVCTFQYTYNPSMPWLGHGADHSSPSNAEIKNEWSYTYSPPYVFMVWCLIKQWISSWHCA